MAKILAWANIYNKKMFDCDCIVFDMTGTIVRAEPLLYSLGKARQDKIASLIGEQEADLWAEAVGIDFRKIWIDKHGPLAKAPRDEEILVATAAIYRCGLWRKVKEWSWHKANRMAEEAYNSADEFMRPPFGAKPIPNVGQALKNLRALGIKIALATTDGRDRTSGILEHFHLEDYFDISITAEDVPKGKRKPHADIVQKACGKMGCTPSECIVVGDSDHDMNMGKNAGVKACIAVLSGLDSLDELERLSDYVIPSVACLGPLDIQK